MVAADPDGLILMVDITIRCLEAAKGHPITPPSRETAGAAPVESCCGLFLRNRSDRGRAARLGPPEAAGVTGPLSPARPKADLAVGRRPHEPLKRPHGDRLCSVLNR